MSHYRPVTPMVGMGGESKGWNELSGHRNWTFMSMSRGPAPSSAANTSSQGPATCYATSCLCFEYKPSGLLFYLSGEHVASAWGSAGSIDSDGPAAGVYM